MRAADNPITARQTQPRLRRASPARRATQARRWRELTGRLQDHHAPNRCVREGRELLKLVATIHSGSLRRAATKLQRAHRFYSTNRKLRRIVAIARLRTAARRHLHYLRSPAAAAAARAERERVCSITRQHIRAHCEVPFPFQKGLLDEWSEEFLTFGFMGGAPACRRRHTPVPVPVPAGRSSWSSTRASSASSLTTQLAEERARQLRHRPSERAWRGAGASVA
jgi:hypothetical protein